MKDEPPATPPTTPPPPSLRDLNDQLALIQKQIEAKQISTTASGTPLPAVVGESRPGPGEAVATEAPPPEVVAASSGTPGADDPHAIAKTIIERKIAGEIGKRFLPQYARAARLQLEADGFDLGLDDTAEVTLAFPDGREEPLDDALLERLGYADFMPSRGKPGVGLSEGPPVQPPDDPTKGWENDQRIFERHMPRILAEMAARKRK